MDEGGPSAAEKGIKTQDLGIIEKPSTSNPNFRTRFLEPSAKKVRETFERLRSPKATTPSEFPEKITSAPEKPVAKKLIDDQQDPIQQLDNLIQDEQLTVLPQLDQLVAELAAYPDLTYSQGKAIFERLGKISQVFSKYRKPSGGDARDQHDPTFWEAERKLRRFDRLSEDLDDLQKALSENPEFDKVDYSKTVDSNNPYYKFVIGSDRKKYYFDKETRAVRRTSNGTNVGNALDEEISSSRAFKGEIAKYGNLASDEARGWIQLRPKGGTTAKTDGRIYINHNFEIQAPSTPRGVTDVFSNLSELFNRKPDLFTSIKVYNFGERVEWVFSGADTAVDTIIGDLNRSDKIVVYFDANKKQEIFDHFSHMFSGQDEQLSLDSVTPRFTEPTRWSGIGFAEEVDEEVGLSRNQLIAQVLQETVKSVPNQERDTFETVLQENFRKFKIDPDNPAYNLR